MNVKLINVFYINANVQQQTNQKPINSDQSIHLLLIQIHSK